MKKNEDERQEHKGYTIGEVSRVTGINRETLRFYDKEGVISPEYVNPNNNYRYYSDAQFWSFDIIQCFRRLGVSLEQIKEVLSMHDNAQVVELMLQQKETAIELSEYYARVADDIEWYTRQNEQVINLYSNNAVNTDVVVKHISERRVLMPDGGDGRSVKGGSYHRRLQELCLRAGMSANQLRRNYGFVLDGIRIWDGKFIKTAEYLMFDEASTDEISDEYVTIIPEGDYACFTHIVYNDKADFSPLKHWLKKEHQPADYIISDEIGLRLFNYLDNGYTCETKVLLK